MIAKQLAALAARVKALESEESALKRIQARKSARLVRRARKRIEKRIERLEGVAHQVL